MLEFINNFATQHVIFGYIILPGSAFLLAYNLLSLLKGKKKLIILFLSILLLFAFILPLFAGVISLILKHQANQIIYIAGLMLMFFIWCSASVEGKFYYAWLSDKDYYAITHPPDGSDVHMNFPHSMILLIAAYYIKVYANLAIIGMLMLMLNLFFDALYIFAISILFVGGVLMTGHVIWRHFIKCPFCHMNVFEFEKNKYRNFKFFKVASSIIKNKEFACMYCGAHFAVKLRGEK